MAPDLNPVHVLRDPRALRLLSANFLFSIGSGLSMIAVPWSIVSLPDGDRLYGQVMLWTTLGLICLLPATGVLIDRVSRKLILQCAQGLGALCVGLCTLKVLLTGSAGFWTLLTIYFVAFTVYTLYYPALFAFTQQVFSREEYGTLAGASEVQGQTASIVAGGLGAALIGKVPLAWILAFDTATYLCAVLLLAGIPYQATHLHGQPAARPGFWRGLREALRYLEERLPLAMVLLASMLPFVGIMVGNYLWPVHVSRVLGSGPTVFAAGEVSFALGAVFAGFVAAGLVRSCGAFQTLCLTIATYTVAFAAMAALPSTAAFLVTMVLIGFGNAGSRVARNLVMFSTVPNALMGRVNAFFSMVDRSLRALLIAVATGAMAAHGPVFGLWLLAVLGVAALAVVVLFRHGVRAQ